MTSNVDSHTELKPKSVVWIKMTESDQKTHCAHSIGQLVQNCPEFSTLVEISCCMTVKCIQKCTCNITPNCYHVIGWHKVERYQGQNHSSVS